MNTHDMLKKKKKEDTENVQGFNGNNSENGQAVIPEVVEEEIMPSAADVLKEELATANDRYLRLYAEFDNFRRRTVKEREEARKMEGKDLMAALLPVLDDFDRALKSMENATDIGPVKEGVNLVQQKLKNILGQKGLKPMESIGHPFDAEVHEAITNVPAPTDDMKGKVIDEMEKGYLLNDKVIRFAKVIVGS
jgi:molecular chaperone GrpE